MRKLRFVWQLLKHSIQLDGNSVFIFRTLCKCRKFFYFIRIYFCIAFHIMLFFPISENGNHQINKELLIEATCEITLMNDKKMVLYKEVERKKKSGYTLSFVFYILQMKQMFSFFLHVTILTFHLSKGCQLIFPRQRCHSVLSFRKTRSQLSSINVSFLKMIPAFLGSNVINLPTHWSVNEHFSGDDFGFCGPRPRELDPM